MSQILENIYKKLQLLNVHFNKPNDEEYSNDAEELVDKLSDANCASSQLKDTDKHILLLDLDVPHVYVESSTPGHGHLYIDVPLNKADHMLVMYTLQYFGIIQPGYFNQLISKGHNALRLPWIKKNSGGGPLEA